MQEVGYLNPMKNTRYKRIFSLALPIIGGMISQNVLNLVDTAMVGSLGNAALAAVGLGGFATFMGQSLILGISTGVQALAARRKGEGHLEQTAFPLNAALILVFVASIILSTFFYYTIPSIYHFLNSDPAVIEVGSPYLQIRLLGIIFVGSNFAFRGFWNAIDLSKIYLFTLVIMHICNILLNYALIFGNLGMPQLGVSGAALGTTISTAIGTSIYFILGFSYARKNGFFKVFPTWKNLSALVKLSLPSSIQQLFFAAGFTALYWIIGKIGTVELAATNVLINVMLLAILPAIGLGLAAATLVGQALGLKRPADAMAWGYDVVKIGVVGIGIVGLPMIFAAEPIIRLFVQDPLTIAVGKLPMQLTGLTIFMEGISLVLMNALLGAGDAKAVMQISISTQWFLFLPLAYICGPLLGMGLLAVWILQIAYRLLLSWIYFNRWKKGHWKTINI